MLKATGLSELISILDNQASNFDTCRYQHLSSCTMPNHCFPLANSWPGASFPPHKIQRVFRPAVFPNSRQRNLKTECVFAIGLEFVHGGTQSQHLGFRFYLHVCFGLSSHDILLS
jgi:hypothetical protein